jgi:hypothetical protein
MFARESGRVRRWIYTVYRQFRECQPSVVENGELLTLCIYRNSTAD